MLMIQLENPIRVNNKGGFEEVELLNVRVCNVLNYNLYADVKGVVTKAIFAFKDVMDTQTEANESTDSSDEVNEFPIDIFASSGTLKEINKVIIAYLVANATWDDDIKVSKSHFNKVSITEFNKIISKVSYFLYAL